MEHKKLQILKAKWKENLVALAFIYFAFCFVCLSKVDSSLDWSVILWWNSSILIWAVSSRMTPPPYKRVHWIFWWGWKACKSDAMSQSADLNLVEYPWEILEGCVRQHITKTPRHIHRVVKSLARCIKTVLVVAQYFTKTLCWFFL